MLTVERSYGLVLYRRTGNGVNDYEFFLVKVNAPGFWEKNSNVWSFPKGHQEIGEEPIETAFREFREEVGMDAPAGLNYTILQPFTAPTGKVITMFYADATGVDVEWVSSISAIGEFPPRSGNMIRYAETVSGGWFPLSELPSMLQNGYLSLARQAIRREHMKKIKTASTVR